jgi:hypothetical protein
MELAIEKARQALLAAVMGSAQLPIVSPALVLP